jgi:DNA-binding phage protein
MDFKTATDRIAAYVSHTEIAEAAGVSVQSIRQARLDSSNPNYRSPPAGWDKVLLRLARERSKHLKALIDELERG